MCCNNVEYLGVSIPKLNCIRQVFTVNVNVCDVTYTSITKNLKSSFMLSATFPLGFKFGQYFLYECIQFSIQLQKTSLYTLFFELDFI